MTYLQVLFPMKHDGFCLYFSVFDVHLVPTEHNRDVLTYPHQVSMPVGYILVGHSCCYVKHNDRTLSLNVVAIP